MSESTANNRFTQLYNRFPQHFYAEVTPEALENAELIHVNEKLCKNLGLNLSHESMLNLTSGIELPNGLQPLAQKYTGHQFGYYNPDLGDGRGVLLGQVKDQQGQHWDLHLKGSGQTPYSRRGDGRAVLRSAVREYLIGEALHALGIPTTRCISLCKNNEQVRREQLEPRASYIRVAKTHIRFGHFEWLAQRGHTQELKQLADYVIETVYPELSEIDNEQQRFAELLKTITRKTAEMIAGWQSVGFCHGVMNTDNMSVAGETFDFGPYAFLDDCRIHHICNHSDTEGRYAYSQQPNIGLWNCQVLANAFSQLVSAEEIEQAINTYIDSFNQTYLMKMGYKFGLNAPIDEDKLLIADTLILMDQSSLDFHYFFTLLEKFDTEEHSEFEAFIGNSKAWRQWQEKYRQRIANENATGRKQRLQNSNPQLILRNYIAQEIIQEVENGNFTVIEEWINWLHQAYQAYPHESSSPRSHYFQPPAVADKSIVLSCSS